MMNWSMAYCALSVMSFGAMTSSSLMSSSILSTSMPTRLTLKSFFSSLTMVQGWLACWPICCIIGLEGMPKTGSGLMRPMIGFSGVSTRTMARVRSYSSSRSRLGARNGMDCLHPRT